MKTALIVLLAATLFAPMLVSAEHNGPSTGRCGSDGAPALGIVMISGGSPETTFYIDDRNLPLANGLWVYMESNREWVDGDAHLSLQRGGASPFIPDDNEVCTDPSTSTPDLLIF